MKLPLRLTGRKVRDAAPLAGVEERLRAKHDALGRLTEANSSALELLADLQQKATGEFLFDMKYVRDASARALALGREVVGQLEQLSDAEEGRLSATLESIRARVEERLRVGLPVPVGPTTLALSAIPAADPWLVGAKMRRLSEVRGGLDVPAPDGFAITTAGCHAFLEQRGLWTSILEVVDGLSLVDRAGVAATSAEIRARIAATPWPERLAETVRRQFDDLQARAGEPALRVSVRSSAIGEDAEFSFAGQYASVLNVEREGLLDACKEVLASQFGPRAVVYYKARGLEATLLPMSIGVLAMVDAHAAGVLYTRSPTSPGDDTMIVTGVWGLGPMAVEGTVAPDTFTISRGSGHDLVQMKIATKRRMLLCRDGPGVVEVAVPRWMQDQPCLTRDQLATLAWYGERLEERYEGPQDIEWVAGPSEEMSVLQTRPLPVPVPGDEAAADAAGARASLPAPIAEGAIGSRGVGAGVVVVVGPSDDPAAVPPGAVWVTRTGRPELAAGLDRASALLVETGSVASHLATIARELRLPALFNVRDAVARLAPGTIVTVDAEMGSVYEGRQESLLRLAASRQKAREPAGTPLFDTLRDVNAWFVPLHLTDPRARQFKPSGCRTLHDVLRYAHEAAMQAMFEAAGDLAGSPERSRRLQSPIPLDFLLIDLGGAVEAGAGASVLPEQLRSRPLLALWSGMTSVPWDTRPAARGALGSLLATGLSTRMSGTEAPERNFILAGSSYVNLHVRFGYHFSRVDAFLGERAQGNYASLLFHGGAADGRGRERRLEFIARILAPRQWRVSRRGDALFGRIEELGAEVLADELRELGRLLMATRQVDVLLGDQTDVDDAVAAYERGDCTLGLGAPAPGGPR